MLARVLELIEKYLRTRTCIAQEILGIDPTRLQNAHGGMLKLENSALEITSFTNFNKICRYTHQEDFIDPCELYLEQQSFSSECKECWYANNKRLNRIVETNLSRYSSNHTVTSDVYNNNQRRDVHNIIDKWV